MVGYIGLSEIYKKVKRMIVRPQKTLEIHLDEEKNVPTIVLTRFSTM